MKNVAYTREYDIYFQKQRAVFRSDFLQQTETTTLSPHYYLKRRFYCGEAGEYTLHGTENVLTDETGKQLYCFGNINNSGEFCKIVEHGDGNKYMIFRSDLYGYSVLNLTTLQDFHFIPAGSFPKGETFIWTDVSYNRTNHVLAVSGCYWSCPFGTLLMDFTYPMKEPEVWVDVQEYMEDGYDRYDDVDFEEWRNTELVLSAFNSRTEKKETVLIPEGRYMEWLKGK